MPDNELDAARADMFVDGVSELFPHIRPVLMAIMSGDEGKKVPCSIICICYCIFDSLFVL